MGRAPCCDKTKVKKGPWSPEEDTTLKNYVERFGTGGNWIALPHKAGLKRCGKSCRLRWLNYLRPDIKHGGFTEDEDKIILTLYEAIGSRWSVIASHLAGRTDNDVKNYWNTKLKKKLLAAGNTTTTTTTPIKTTAKENNSMHFNSSSSSSSSSTPSPTTFVTKVENYYNNYCYGNSSSDCCNPMIFTTFHPAMNANYQQNLSPQQLVSDPRVQVSLPSLMEAPEIGPATADDAFRAISSVQEVSSLPSYGLWFGNGGGEDDDREGFSLMGSTGSGFSYGPLNGFDFQGRDCETFPNFANSF